jgi:hypothetical protein
VSILLTGALLFQAQPALTPDEARTGMAMGTCIASHAHQFADRPEADDVVAAAILDACADLERRIIAAAAAGHEDAAEFERGVHALILQRALAMVRQVRTGSAPTGPGSEIQIWSHCVSDHVISRANGRGRPEEIVRAAERDCAPEEAAARASIIRESGPAEADAEMAQMLSLNREDYLALVARIRSSDGATAPSRPEPK